MKLVWVVDSSKKAWWILHVWSRDSLSAITA